MKRATEPRRWAGKRTRAADYAAFLAQHDLIPLSESERIGARMWQKGRDEGAWNTYHAAIERLQRLRGGLAGIVLGPIGKAQMDAYDKAIAVLQAERYTDPCEVRSVWMSRWFSEPRTG